MTWPHSMKVVSLISEFDPSPFCVQFALDLSGFSSFLAQSKNMHGR